MKRRFFKLLLYLVGLIILIISFAFLYRVYKQKEIYKNSNLDCKKCIDSLITFNVSENKLTGLIRTKDYDNPILLFVHGGPGIPDMPFARTFDNLLINDFIVIHYDQRGIGKSINNYNVNNITIEDNITDLIFLTEEIRKKFINKKIFLVGHSWGTLISFLAIKERPDLFDYYVGISQIVSLSESDKYSFDYTKKISKEMKDSDAIFFHKTTNRENFYLNHELLLKQRQYLSKFGGRFYNTSIKSELTKNALFSPEYSIKELMTTKNNSKILDKRLYAKMTEYNLRNIADTIKIPILFVCGKFDYNTPYQFVNDLYNKINCEHKSIIIFEESGHLPHYEEPNKFYETLKKIK